MEVYRQREGLYVKMWWKRGCEEKEAPTVQLITPLAFVCDEATPEREPEGRSLGGAVPIVENTAGPLVNAFSDKSGATQICEHVTYMALACIPLDKQCLSMGISVHETLHEITV
jgi:hypothetical protein